NMGVRWDADPNMASPPNIRTNDILIDPGITQTYSSRIAGVADYGYKSGIRDWTNIAPRAGFTYNVGGGNDLVIRGGSGLYFASPVSNVTFSPQFYSQLVSATFVNDAGADGADDLAGLQVALHLAEQHRLPEADQRRHRLRRRPHALDRVPRHADDRRQPRLQPHHRLQPGGRIGAGASEPGLRRRLPVRLRRQARSDGDCEQPDAAVEEPLPGRPHLHADARDEGQRRRRLRQLAGEQPVRLSRRRDGDLGRLPAQHRPPLGADAAAVGPQHQRDLLLWLGEPLQQQHLHGAVRQARHEPAEPDGHRHGDQCDHDSGVGAG